MLTAGSFRTATGAGEKFLPAPPPRRRRLWARSGLLAIGLWVAPGVFAQQQRTAASTAAWEVLTGCRLVTNAVVDGDSFHVLYRERKYVFRLYFVDAPESDAALTERAKEQAAYFGIRPDDIPRAGKSAARFTRETLAGREFTVITRWQNALGRSSLARFYGVVLVGGKNLAEELVAHGHARIYGLRANWPDGPRSTTFINRLKNLELTAREQKRGAWDAAKFPRAAAGAPASTNLSETTSAPATALTDLNMATFEELQELPGIGPKLAERIMAHRPFERVEDLDRVPGIGPVMMKRLLPRIKTGNTAP